MGTSQEIDVEPIRLVTSSPEETMELGAQFAKMCKPNDIIGLQGTLGAGKTIFVKGMARGLGVKDLRAVTSPTFVLLHQYKGKVMLNHFDAYRLEDARQLEEIGCQEVFKGGGVSVVEWANHVAACLPKEHFLVTIRMVGEAKREFLITACGDAPLGRLRGIFAELEDWEE